jgi:hypothetical protein
MVAPTGANHATTVASAADSPNWGMRTESFMGSLAGASDGHRVQHPVHDLRSP